MTKCTKARVMHGSEKGIRGEEIQSSVITYVKQVQTVTSAHMDVKADSQLSEMLNKGPRPPGPWAFYKNWERSRETKAAF